MKNRTHKTCKICNDKKPIAGHFYVSKSRPAGSSYCIECSRVKSKSKYVKHPKIPNIPDGLSEAYHNGKSIMELSKAYDINDKTLYYWQRRGYIKR